MTLRAGLRQFASPGARASRRKKRLQFVKDVPTGFQKDAIDTAKGLKQTAFGIWKLTGGALIDPKDAAARWKLVGKVAREIIKHPSILGKALVAPYVEAWKSGHPGEAVGRALFQITAALAGGEVLAKLTHSLERAGKLLNLAVNSADDIAAAAARLGLVAEQVTADK
jgi:hypothetical protein